jgi:membrane protease YdiL (CAAX protease family)
MSKNKLPVSRIAFAFTFVLFMIQFGSIGLTIIVQKVAPYLFNYSWFAWVVNYGTYYLIYFPIFFLLLRNIPNTDNAIARPKPRSITIPRFLVIILSGYGICTSLNIVTNLISAMMNYLLGAGVDNPMAAMLSASDVITNIIMVVGIAPLMEELIFRKFLYNKLIGYGPNLYILVSSLAFMCFHPNLYQMCYAFVLGLILSSLYAYSGKFRYCWCFHVAINGTTGVTLLMSNFVAPTLPWLSSLYVLLLMFAAFAGFITAICLLAIYHKRVKFGYGAPLPIKNAAAPILNPGMITLYVLFFLSILLTQLAGLGVLDGLFA